MSCSSIVVKVQKEQSETSDEQKAQDEESEVSWMLGGWVQVGVASHKVFCWQSDGGDENTQNQITTTISETKKLANKKNLQFSSNEAHT